MSALFAVVAQGIPLSPPLGVRLVALVIVEVVLLTTAVLLYIRWKQFTREPLDEWWERRKQTPFSARTRALIEDEERQRLAAAAEAEGDGGAGDAPG